MITVCGVCGMHVLGNRHMCPKRVRVWEVTCCGGPSSYVSAQSADEAACVYAEEFDTGDASTFSVRESSSKEWTDVVIHGLDIVATDI
jgi:hypothetical protein